VGRQEPERAHHVLGRVREGRGTENFGNFVVYLRENVEQGEEGLVVVEGKWLKGNVL
jgi:hypothetical protein